VRDLLEYQLVALRQHRLAVRIELLLHLG
jgi:hypothetical protein